MAAALGRVQIDLLSGRGWQDHPVTPTPDATTRSPYARAAAPALASFGVLVWLIGLMGIIDLTVPLIPLEDFYNAYLIETSWGLLYTVLLGVPTAVLAIRPQHDAAAQQILAAAAALALGAAAAPELGHLVPAAVAVGLVAAIRALSGARALPPSPQRRLTRRDLPVAVVVLAGLLPAMAIASQAITAFRDPTVSSDVTQNLDHWPAHAAFALATFLAGALAMLRTRGAWLPASTAAFSAAWFGATSIAFPDHDGSLGTTGGWLAIAWGVALLGAVLARRGAAPGIDGAAADPEAQPEPEPATD